MNTFNQKKSIQKVLFVVHFIALAIFLSEMLPAAWRKITEFEPMMKGMASYGYDRGITLFIGWVEIIGATVLILGIFKPAVKNVMAVLLLFVVTGAMATHLAVRDYVNIHASVLCCISLIIMLTTSESFKLFFNYKHRKLEVS